jgi:hypothetical protein
MPAVRNQVPPPIYKAATHTELIPGGEKPFNEANLDDTPKRGFYLATIAVAVRCPRVRDRGGEGSERIAWSATRAGPCAWVICPGLAFARWIRSLTERMSESALTTSAKGTNWILVIGVIPRIGSYGQFFWMLGPTLSVLLEPIIRVIGATARAVTSTLPPAAKGTMMWMGSLGKA